MLDRTWYLQESKNQWRFFGIEWQSSASAPARQNAIQVSRRGDQDAWRPTIDSDDRDDATGTRESILLGRARTQAGRGRMVRAGVHGWRHPAPHSEGKGILGVTVHCDRLDRPGHRRYGRSTRAEGRQVRALRRNEAGRRRHLDGTRRRQSLLVQRSRRQHSLANRVHSKVTAEYWVQGSPLPKEVWNPRRVPR